MIPSPPDDPPPVWWNGRLVPASEALVATTCQGWLWGRGLFETIAVRGAQPLALTRHLTRFRAGAERLALQPPDDDALRRAIAAVLTGCPPELHRLRLTLTGGDTPGLALTPEAGHLLIRRQPAAPPPHESLLLTVPWRRNEFSALCAIKSTAYAENAVALAWAREKGATEALFLNTAGDLCEGAVTNLFLVREGTVLTPSQGSGCLPGIARSLILDLCPQLGIPCQEKALVPADLTQADEVFLTNSLHGVQPVFIADHRPLPAPGPVTASLAAALTDLLHRLPDP
jgi:branched-chain amino acid aminotransferase